MAVPSHALAKKLLKAAVAIRQTHDVPNTWLWCSRGFTIGAHLNTNAPKGTRQFRKFCECTLSEGGDDSSVREVLAALGVPESDRGKTLVGPKVLQIPAQGTVDILEAFIFVSFRSLGLDCAFVDTSHLAFRGGNLHCATNRLPDLDALGWDVDDLGEKLLT